MNKLSIASTLLQALTPLVAAALTWLGTQAARLISVRVRNEQLKGVLLRLDDAVLSVVRELNQVMVDALRTSAADGKLTTDAIARVKQAALASLKQYLGTRGLAEIARVLAVPDAALDRLLGTRIEAAVNQLKTRPFMNGVNHFPHPDPVA